jgi:hypothetical protein
MTNLRFPGWAEVLREGMLRKSNVRLDQQR